MRPLTVAVLAGLAVVVGMPRPAAAQTTIVTHSGAVLRAAPSDTATAVTALPKQTAIELWRGMPEPGQQWFEVRATPSSSVEGVKGWIRADDIQLSSGILALWWRRLSEAAAQLPAEISATTDPETAQWLSFQLGYTYQLMQRLDDAAALFERLARQRPINARTPFGYLAAARVQLERQNAQGSLRVYEALLDAEPDFVVSDRACAASGVAFDHRLCSGEPRITARAGAWRALIDRQAATDRVVVDSAATAEQKARAWFGLAEEWERKNAVDPGRQETGVPSEDPQRCYAAAIAAAPGTVLAGNAQWRLIALSAPYEWEGNVTGMAQWLTRKFGDFLSDYPSHPHAGEALFNVARARWAAAGYPEVFGYIFTPGGWPAWRARAAVLDAWFDTRGFGGGAGGPVLPVNRDETLRALAMFKDVVTRYPTSPAAAEAQYDAAVILDYCLNDKARAIVDFEAFLTLAPQLEPFATKARARLTALRRDANRRIVKPIVDRHSIDKYHAPTSSQTLRPPTRDCRARLPIAGALSRAQVHQGRSCQRLSENSERFP